MITGLESMVTVSSGLESSPFLLTYVNAQNILHMLITVYFA